jgi:hypothetical protein
MQHFAATGTGLTQGLVMPRRKQQMERLSTPVTPQQKAILEDMAKRSRLSIARILHEAVRVFIEQHPDRMLPLFDSTQRADR